VIPNWFIDEVGRTVCGTACGGWVAIAVVAAALGIDEKEFELLGLFPF
jgi:hypothetical protein